MHIYDSVGFGFQLNPHKAFYVVLCLLRSGMAEVVLTRAAPTFSHTYTIDLATPGANILGMQPRV